MKLKHMLLKSALVVFVCALLTSCMARQTADFVADTMEKIVNNTDEKLDNKPEDLDEYVEQITETEEFKEASKMVFGENNKTEYFADDDYFVVSYTIEEDMYEEYGKIAEYQNRELKEYLTAVLTEYTQEEIDEIVRDFKDMLADGKLQELNDDGADIDLDGVVVKYYAPDETLICKQTFEF